MPEDEVRRALLLPSLQTELLLQDYVTGPDTHVDSARLHSGTAPATFPRHALFNPHIKAFLAPIYERRANQIEKLAPGFRRQWAYEWEIVRARGSFQLTAEPLRFWLGWREEDQRCPS